MKFIITSLFSVFLFVGPAQAQDFCLDLCTDCSITATDALAALNAAVGLNPAMCMGSTTTTTVEATTTTTTLASTTTTTMPMNCPATGLPATGQTTSYGPGSDGDVQAGAALSYVDNGDGTITDNNTGLMWEKQDDSGGIHDKDNRYTWSTETENTENMDGTMVTVFLDTLNDVAGGGASCFAGHCDWRIPNGRELDSIVDWEVLSPSIDPIFHQLETCTGCTDVTLATCSCTASSFYWSSTTFAAQPRDAWAVGFSNGSVTVNFKTFTSQVRAVRGGL
jgi:hypothetical protein